MASRTTLFLVAFTTSIGVTSAQVELRVDLYPQDGSPHISDAMKLGENCDIVLTVSNGTTDSIDIPQNYSPETVRLCASGSFGTQWPLVLRRTKARGGKVSAVPSELKTAMISLAPGKKHEIVRVDAKQTIFAPANIYTLEPQTEFAAERWVWTWPARPGPDYSPFEKRKGDRRSSAAVLWCEVDIDGQTFRSIPVLINDVRKGGG